MTYQPDPQAIANEALETLRLIQMDESLTPTARVSAAKALLDRFDPTQDEDARRREAEERDAALSAARGLLADIAVACVAGLREPPAVAEVGAAQPADAADNG